MLLLLAGNEGQRKTQKQAINKNEFGCQVVEIND